MNERRTLHPPQPAPDETEPRERSDEDSPVRPTRPPRVEDFIIDRDKSDPLRWFRF